MITIEVSVHGHRIDLQYAGYSHVIEFKDNIFIDRIAPMIKVDGQRVQLGRETFLTAAEAKANAKHYLAELSQKFLHIQDK